MSAWLLGGIGLFFIGVRFISANMRHAAGPRMRSMIARAVARTRRAMVVGLVAGAVTQSARAVTFIAVGLAAAGLIGVRQAIPVVAWSNVGTSALVFVATIDIRAAVLYLLALVGIAHFLGGDTSERFRHVVGVALGIALLFLALQFIRTGAAPLSGLASVQALLVRVADHSIFVLLLGALLAFLVQSTTSVAVVAVAMTQAGALPMAQTALVLYGASLGSSAALYLMSGNLTGTQRQVALAQVGFNAVAVAVLLPAWALEASGVPLVLAALAAITSDVALQVALLFLLLQGVGAVIVTAFRTRVAGTLARWAPVTALEQLSRPAFLYAQAAEDSSVAIPLLLREQAHAWSHLPAYLRVHDGAAPAPAAALIEADRAVGREVEGFLKAAIDAERDRRQLDALLELRSRQGWLNDVREATFAFQRALDGVGAAGDGRFGVAERLAEPPPSLRR